MLETTFNYKITRDIPLVLGREEARLKAELYYDSLEAVKEHLIRKCKQLEIDLAAVCLCDADKKPDINGTIDYWVRTGTLRKEAVEVTRVRTVEVASAPKPWCFDPKALAGLDAPALLAMVASVDPDVAKQMKEAKATKGDLLNQLSKNRDKEA